MVKLSQVFRRGNTAGLPGVLDVAIGCLYFDTTLQMMFRSNGVIWEQMDPDSLVNPMTTLGDLIRGGASGAPTRVGIGSAGQVLVVSGGVPTWDTAAVNPHEFGAIDDRDLIVAPGAGMMYWPDDDVAIGRYDGSAWEDWAPLYPYKRWPSGTLATLAWVNQGTATATESAIGMLHTPASSGTLRVLKKSTPATPWTLTVGCVFNGSNSGSGWCGPCWRESSSGKIIAVTYNCGHFFTITKYTNATTFSATYIAHQLPVWSRAMWMRITDDGTNRKTYFSFDRYTWWEVHSVGRTDFLTADEFGIVVDSGGNAHQCLWIDWEVT